MYIQKTMESENQGIQSQFLTRLTSLPVVHTAWGQATATYDRVKHFNSLLDYTMSTVEKSVLYANEKAKPIVKKFEKGISSADLLACKGLDKLEQTVPMIKESPEKILQDTKALYDTTVQTGLTRYNALRSYGTDKVNAVKEYGTKRASDILTSEYAKLLTSSVDGALCLTENCIDFYLPALDDDEKVQTKKEKPVLERMSYLSTVVQRRARKMALLKLQEFQTASTNAVQTINLSGHLTNIRAVPEQLYTNAFWLWEELNKLPEPASTTSTPTLQQQAWITARVLTQSLVNTYATTITTVQRLPEHLHSGMNYAYTYTTDIYTTVQKIVPQELPMQLASQAGAVLNVNERMNNAVQLFVHLPAFQWLVHVYRTQTSAKASSDSGDSQQ